MCSLDIFVDLQPFSCNFKWGLFEPPVWGLEWTWGSGIGQFKRPSMAPINCTLTHMVYLLPFLSYLTGSKSVFIHPPVHPTQTQWQLPLRRSYWFVEWKKWKSHTVHSILLKKCNPMCQVQLHTKIWQNIVNTDANKPALKQVGKVTKKMSQYGDMVTYRTLLSLTFPLIQSTGKSMKHAPGRP